MKKSALLATFWALLILPAIAQNLNNTPVPEIEKKSFRKEIKLPDIPGYKTLKCDFHIHTVFSDGLVWPTVRVTEAWEEGLDAIAITDHLEYKPHGEFVKGDHNSSYEIAQPAAEAKNLILVRGGEITRSMPPGHLNGLFLKDVNALDKEDPLEAIREVKHQGGFIQWNHPGWKAQQPDTCLWMEMHQQLFEEGLIHGIEVFNHTEWYPVALDWCLNKDLAVMGNSDIHKVTAHKYHLHDSHRPLTLVFAKERTKESLKEAMFARRTVAWFDGKMAGPEKLLKAFLKASLDIQQSKDSKRLQIKNLADMPFVISAGSNFNFTIPALGEVYITVPDEIDLVNVSNLYTQSEQCLIMDLKKLTKYDVLNKTQ